MNLFDISTIKQLIGRYGFNFSKSLGQNFLTARWVPDKIISLAQIDESTGVLEIGPGIGALTSELSKTAGRVVAVEIDKKLIPLLRETLGICSNVDIVNENILKTDLQALVSGYFEGLRPVVCANLPYNITTPVLSKLIEAGCFEKITVMVQKEVALRICSRPGTSEYGAFTVYINYHCMPEILFDVPPDCFIPRPGVTSSVISLTPKEKPDFVNDESMFFKIVRAAFAQRRKTLVNALSSCFGGKPDKTELARIISGCGYSEKIRGETLGIPEFAAISNAVGNAVS